MELEDEAVGYLAQVVDASRLLVCPVPEATLLTAVALHTVAVGVLAVEISEGTPAEGLCCLLEPEGELLGEERGV